jgi:uncharacterized membrane protein
MQEVRSIKRKLVKLDNIMQRNLFMSIVLITLAVVYLFNIYWEPLIFMVYSSYVILNKNKAITLGEMLGLSLVIFLLAYAMVARMFGRGPGMFVGAFVLIVAIVISEVLYLAKGGKKK